MSLPVNDTAWPPAPLQPVFSMIDEASAWWAGEPKRLSSHYAGSQRVRPSQFDGGLVGATSRFFWGKPPTPGQQDIKLHLPMAADLANTSASMLFDTPPKFMAVDNDKAQARLDLMLNNDQFPSDLLVAGESCAALGGVAWRIMWDTEVEDHPWIDFVDTDSIIPEFSYGRVRAITFVEELAKVDDKHVHRLLSRYSKGRIDYGLYQGKDDNLGKQIPFDSHPATQALAQVVDADSGVVTGAPGISAGYIPNAMPNVGFRKSGALKNYGRPDISPDLWPLMDFLDETWTNLRREMRLSKAKIILPEYMLDTGKFGGGMSYDHDRESYSPLNDGPNGIKPEMFQPDMRVEKLLAITEATSLEILRRANYSPSTFGWDGKQGQMTAREIDDRYQSTLQTWRAKSRYWKAGMSRMAVDLVAVDNHIFRGGATLDDAPVIEFTAPVKETMKDKAQTLQALDSARAVSTETKVDFLWPEWTDTQRSEEVERINIETGAALDHMGSLNPDQALGFRDAPATTDLTNGIEESPTDDEV